MTTIYTEIMRQLPQPQPQPSQSQDQGQGHAQEESSSEHRSLREECFQRVHHIALVKGKAVPSLLDGNFSFFVEAITRDGQLAAYEIVKSVRPSFFSEENGDFMRSFHQFLDKLPVETFEDVLERVVEKGKNIRDLFPSIGSLMKQLKESATALTKHRLLILGVFLSMVLVDPSALADHLMDLVTSCLSYATLYIPLCKILAIVGSSSHLLSLQSLKLLVRMARTSEVVRADPSIQSALLDAINIVKDGAQFCNLFSPDTLAVLATMESSNVVAYQNILTWNQGRSARIGNSKDFLINAGRVVTAEDAKKARSFTFFGLFGRSSASASSSVTGGKKGAAVISPSPLSQDLAQAAEKTNNMDSKETLPQPQTQLPDHSEDNASPLPSQGTQPLSALESPNPAQPAASSSAPASRRGSRVQPSDPPAIEQHEEQPQQQTQAQPQSAQPQQTETGSRRPSQANVLSMDGAAEEVKGAEEVMHEVPLVSHKGSLLGKFFPGHNRPKSALPASSSSKVGIAPAPAADLLQSTSAHQLQAQQSQEHLAASQPQQTIAV